MSLAVFKNIVTLLSTSQGSAEANRYPSAWVRELCGFAIETYGELKNVSDWIIALSTEAMDTRAIVTEQAARIAVLEDVVEQFRAANGAYERVLSRLEALERADIDRNAFLAARHNLSKHAPIPQSYEFPSGNEATRAAFEAFRDRVERDDRRLAERIIGPNADITEPNAGETMPGTWVNNAVGFSFDHDFNVILSRDADGHIIDAQGAIVGRITAGDPGHVAFQPIPTDQYIPTPQNRGDGVK